jgi:hypothetical protein
LEFGVTCAGKVWSAGFDSGSIAADSLLEVIEVGPSFF